MAAQAIKNGSTYLTFGLGEETFGLDVTNVREVLDLIDITRVPRTPDFMRGVINLRGAVVPVVDMRIRFGLPVQEDTVDTCIIVVEVNLEGEAIVIGALADSVKEVFDIPEDEIEPPPGFGMQLDTDFIRGMGKQGGEFIIILDANRIFRGDELFHFKTGEDVPGSGTLPVNEANETVQDTTL